MHKGDGKPQSALLPSCKQVDEAVGELLNTSDGEQANETQKIDHWINLAETALDAGEVVKSGEKHSNRKNRVKPNGPKDKSVG